MIYKWTQSGFGDFYPVEAQVAGEELERIDKKYSGILLENVVAESRNEEAVLHGCFEWNDSMAAEKQREEQARVLIKNLCVIRIGDKSNAVEPIIPVRAFVNVTSKDTNGQTDQDIDCNNNDVLDEYGDDDSADSDAKKWVSIENVCYDKELMDQVLRQAIKDLLKFKFKYYNLIMFQEIFDVIDSITSKAVVVNDL